MKRITNRLLAAALAATMCVGAVPVPASAETSQELQAKLDKARVTLDEMAAATAAAGEQLNDTLYQLDETKRGIEETSKAIDKKTEELANARDVLSSRISSNYKTGGTTILSILMGSASFDDLVSGIYYADKIAEQDSQAIAQVNTLRVELEEKQESLRGLERQQSELAAQQEANKATLERRQAEQQSYVDGLDVQVQQKIEEERQAELERQRQEAAAAEAAAQAAAAAAAAAQQQQSQAAPVESPAPATATGNTSNAGTATTPITQPVVSGGGRAAVLTAARSQLGVPYVYGGYSPGVGLDCSGFVKYCYACAGVTLPHSSVAQSAYIKRKALSEMQPGDLVFWLGNVSNSGSGSHVAIYYGNGQVIHANGSRVVISALSGGYTSMGSVF